MFRLTVGLIAEIRCRLPGVANMLSTMNGAELLRDARVSAGLSRKALAARAGMPTSTISRVEDGTSSPTVNTLERALAAAGRYLVLDTTDRPTAPSLASLHDAWIARQDDADWTRLRAFVDHLHLHPEQVDHAIRLRPRPSADTRLDNLLAAIAEKTADDNDTKRPRWTGSVPPLTEPWQSSGTPQMRRRESAAAPEQFIARGIEIAATNVWRSHG